MASTQIWLIRHGETAWNATRRLQGWQDVPLNDIGEQQAHRLASFLASEKFNVAFDGVVSSDLKRAVQTATIACASMHLPVQLDQGLRERGFGVLEGQSWDSLGGGRPDQPSKRTDIAPEGAETLQGFQQRVLRAMERLAEQYPQQKLAVFAHGGVIDMVWRRLLQVDLYAPRTQTILNTSINHFSISPTADGYEWTVQQWGQVSHITDSALDDIG